MISAVILTKNSASSIASVFDSVSFCDEIIVIDDNSTDDTVNIAKKLGAIVYIRAVHEDFAEQRNFGFSKANGEWILFVDSDETVSDELATEIREAIKKIDVNGFYLKRQDVMWGRALRFGETERVRLLRLAKRGKGVWQRPVHEVWKITGPVATLQHPLQHSPHPDVAHFLKDINTYSTIHARHVHTLGIRVFWWHIALYPTAKFFQNYILRRGFLDGMPGIIVAFMMSFHSFLTRAKLWQLWQTSQSR